MTFWSLHSHWIYLHASKWYLHVWIHKFFCISNAKCWFFAWQTVSSVYRQYVTSSLPAKRWKIANWEKKISESIDMFAFNTTCSVERSKKLMNSFNRVEMKKWFSFGISVIEPKLNDKELLLKRAWFWGILYLPLNVIVTICVWMSS